MPYTCRSCGQRHDEEANCFVIELPLYAAQVPDHERARRVDATSDQCVVDKEHFFILGNVDVKVPGSELFIRWSVWTTLSKANFLRASELWHVAGREAEPPYFGWLSNQIPGYPDTLNIKTMVQTQPVGIRPQIRCIEEGHPLAGDQGNGVTVERLRELIHFAQAS
jgi:hypothetical protein